MTRLSLPAPAKINLYLEVVGRRADGFHELVTVLHALELADDVTVTLRDRSTPGPDPDIRLTIEAEPTSTADLPRGPTNLAWRAAADLLRAAGAAGDVGVDVALLKRVPAGGGLGGGSSDAATVLTALHRLLGAPLGADALHGLAAALGSDVPFFLTGGTCLCTGRGEIVRPLTPPQPADVTLGLPPFGAATAAVYAALSAGAPSPVDRGRIDEIASRVAGASVQGLRDLYRNDLEAPARAVEPRLASILAGGGLCLSGSGSTVYELGGADAVAETSRWFPGIQSVRTRSYVR